MNTFILIANALMFVAFIVHTFVGDRELKLIAPDPETDTGSVRLEKWTMARGGWHWVSLDLLFATIGLSIINFTNYIESEVLLLKILMLYFFGYGLVWLVVIAISRNFPKNYLKLGQWMLLWLISGLIYLGTSQMMMLKFAGYLNILIAIGHLIGFGWRDR